MKVEIMTPREIQMNGSKNRRDGGVNGRRTVQNAKGDQYRVVCWRKGPSNRAPETRHVGRKYCACNCGIILV